MIYVLKLNILCIIYSEVKFDFFILLNEYIIWTGTQGQRQESFFKSYLRNHVNYT